MKVPGGRIPVPEPLAGHMLQHPDRFQVLWNGVHQSPIHPAAQGRVGAIEDYRVEGVLSDGEEPAVLIFELAPSYGCRVDVIVPWTAGMGNVGYERWMWDPVTVSEGVTKTVWHHAWVVFGGHMAGERVSCV